MNSVFAKFTVVVALLALVGCAMPPIFESASSAPKDVDLKQTSDAEREQTNPYLEGRAALPEFAAQRFGASLQALEQQDWVLAANLLQALTSDFPQLSGPCLNLALLYRAQGELEQAEYWYRQSVARNGNNVVAYNQYGVFLREQGRFDEAEVAYLQALTVWEDDPQSHRNIAILYDLYRGEQDKALRHYYRYQALSATEDRTVAGWIVDLERQMNTVARED